VTSPAYPLRILHVVGGMNIGGTETWLMHVLRHLDPRRYRMDFLVHTAEPRAYDAEIRAHNCRILPCLSHKRPWMYSRRLQDILRDYGPYDIIHSHVHHFTGVVLRTARRAHVPMRIAHSHSDTSRIQGNAGPVRRAYCHVMRRWIRRNATVGLAVSRKAAAALFGPSWAAEKSCRILYCGVDFAPFQSLPDAGAVRAEWGIPSDAFVVGHVGSFSPPKNHAFLVEIAKELVRREPETRFLWVGDGALRPAVQAQVMQAGLDRNVCFAGVRRDVARLLAAMDVFVFPSLWEGMPLSLIEAQAAGLRCVVSEAITAEARAVEPLIRPLSLACPASAWAEQILAVRRERPSVRRIEALAMLERSHFSIESSLRALEATYDDR
jgi:glycosyltransferase involved in cell wall biosynthesis